MRSKLATAALALATAALLIAAAPSARAEELAAAKAAGQVGERADGYLGVVAGDAAPAAIRQLAGEINARRRLKYAEIAKENGTEVDAVAALAGIKLVERTPAGQYVMGSDGRWVEK